MANSSDVMFKRIMCNEGVFYKLQQRGDPDLTDEEKRSILQNLFTSNPRLFMSRYFAYLLLEDCDLFDCDDYEIAFYIRKVAGKFEKRQEAEMLKRNVRYAELERLKKEGDYFSYAKMREREPLLFDKMIGQFLPEEDQIFLRPTIENESLSGLLMQFEEAQIVSDRRKMQVDEEAFGFQPRPSNSFDSSVTFAKLALHAECRQSPEKDVEEELEEEMGLLNIEPQPSQSEDLVVDSEDEKDEERMKSDFIDFMEQRFLGEKDAEFFDYPALYERRYSKDLEKMRNQDIEDAYFADE